MPEGQQNMEESYRVMLVRLEGKIDLITMSATHTAADIVDIRNRLNGHSERLLKHDLAAARQLGAVTLAKVLYAGVGAALAAGAAILARHWGM